MRNNLLHAVCCLLFLTPVGAASATNVSQLSTNAAATNAAAATMATLDDDHKLATGDKLSFRIVEDLEDPKPLVVTDSGDIEVPYIGRFAATGKSCRQLARELKVELEKEYYIDITVILAVDQMSLSRGRAYLVGSIRIPGPQEIPGNEVFTLSKAIMRAGGFSDFADKKHVRVTRKMDHGSAPDRTFVVNVGRVIESGETKEDLKLEPGDLIYVPKRLVSF